MEQADALALMVAGPACRAAEASDRVPDRPGYYAIFVDDALSLPDPYRDILRARGTRLIYIGIATKSLRERLVEQDLRHRSPATFFRAIGPILGYRPAKGSLVGRSNQNNYRFIATDTAAIIRWIDGHLSVNWSVAEPAMESTETALIQAHRPLLNTEKSPEPLTALASLRDECRRIAREDPTACTPESPNA